MFKKLLAVLTAAMILFAAVGVAYADWDCDFSVGAKPAPEPVPITVPGEDEPIVGIIRDSEGNVVVYVPVGALIITAYSEKDQAEVSDITATLDTAYGQLVPTPIADLNPGVAAYVEANAPEIDPNYLVVRDLFDARLVGEYADYLDVPGNTLEITFDADISDDCFLMVMSNKDIYNSSLWDIIPVERLTRNDDNTIGIVFDYLCPIIFVTKCHYAPNPPVPPHTGTAGYVLLGVAVIALGAGLVLFRKHSGKA